MTRRPGAVLKEGWSWYEGNQVHRTRLGRALAVLTKAGLFAGGRGRALVLLATCCLLVLPACRREESAASRPAGAQPVEKTAKRGPIAVVLWANRGEFAVGDRIHLALEVTAPEGFEIVLAKATETLGELHVASALDRGDVPVAQGRQWRREYELNADVPGDFEIPAQTVRYADRRSSGHAATTQASQPIAEIESPKLTVKVVSSLKGGFKPDEFSDIKGLVELPREFAPRWLWWGLVPVAVLLVAAVVLLVRSRRITPVRAEPVVRPDVWAREQLRRLREEQLVERGLVAEFYFRLTGIIRVYIERRFAVRAPEQTTEEFLAAAQDHPALGVRYGRLLASFLEAGDLVKFARYQPGTAEIDRAFDTAEAFVDQRAVEEPAADAEGPLPADATKSPQTGGGTA